MIIVYHQTQPQFGIDDQPMELHVDSAASRHWRLVLASAIPDGSKCIRCPLTI